MKTKWGDIMQEDLNNNEQPVLEILKAAKSILTSTQATGNTDSLKDIFEFILNVFKQVGFDFKTDTNTKGPTIRMEDIILSEKPTSKWFSQVSEKDVNPGDFVTYLDSTNQKTMGLIESYDSETKTGTMYAMDELRGEVSSLDFAEGDIEEMSFLRPNMDFFMGNLAGLFAGMDEDYDEDQYSSFYPSPSP